MGQEHTPIAKIIPFKTSSFKLLQRGVSRALYAVVAVELTLLVTGARILYKQTNATPVTAPLQTAPTANPPKKQQTLACHTFTGRSLQTLVVPYDPTNKAGFDECPFISQRTAGDSATSNIGVASSISDWSSVIAVLIALFGYLRVENHRRKDASQRDQDIAYQIAHKVASLRNDAIATLNLLTPNGKTAEELQSITSPFEVIGMQQPAIGLTEMLVHDLSDSERNLLLKLREADFMMDFTEAFAQNSAINHAIKDYKSIYDALEPYFPEVITQGPGFQNRGFKNLQDAIKAYPRFYAAASTIKTLRRRAIKNVRELERLSEEYQPMMQRHFPDLHIVSFNTIVAAEDVEMQDASRLDPPPSSTPRSVPAQSVSIRFHWRGMRLDS